MAVAVDMLVDRDGFWGTNEGHLRRVEGIFDIKFELNDELLAIIERVSGARHLHFPNSEIISLQSFLVQLQALGWRADKTLQFFLKPLQSRSADLLISPGRHGAATVGAGRTDR